jgi:nitrite reductase/ring-hydroxylating ferredoxin subunit
MSGASWPPVRGEGAIALRLSAAERSLAETGVFIRLDLPRPILLPNGEFAATVLVARVDRQWRAYANVCRHKAIPLDARGGTELGVMTDDRRHLLCDSHGALYKPADGLCVSGPCAGTHLFAFVVDEAENELRLTLAVR